MSDYKKLFVAGFIALVLVVGGALTPTAAQAQTIEELQAQVAALLAQLAALQGQSSAPSGWTAPQPPLTEGSSGAGVVALQQFLVQKGYLTMPTGVAMGYFGTLTKAALAAYQAANGITPAEGYYGPITYQHLLTVGGGTTSPGTSTTCPPGQYDPMTGQPCPTGTTTVPGCMPGYLYSPTTGQSCSGTGTSAPAGITTPGVVSVLTVSKNPTPGSGTVVRGGDKMVPLIGIKVKSDVGDTNVDFVRMNLPALSAVTKQFKNLYLIGPNGETLSELINASSYVNEEGTTKFVVFSNFNHVVPKGATHVLTVNADMFDNVSGNTGNVTVTIPANGTKGIDGAGRNQDGPGTAFTNTVNIQTLLADAPTLTVSLSSDSPLASQVIATAGSSRDEIQAPYLELARFEAVARNDDVKIRQWDVSVYKSGSGGATAGTAYLCELGSNCDGSNVLASASISGSAARFEDLELVVPRDTTRKFSLRANITAADDTVAGFTASTSGSGIVAEGQSQGATVSPSGAASSTETINVLDRGLEISLLSKNISTDGVPQNSGSNNLSTSTLSATFTYRLKAVDGSVLLGNNASVTPAFGISTAALAIYVNGSRSATISSYATSSDATFGNYNASSNTITLNDGQSVDPVFTFQILGRTTSAALTSGLYSVAPRRVTWIGPTGATVNTDFMDDKVSWRTSNVTFP